MEFPQPGTALAPWTDGCVWPVSKKKNGAARGGLVSSHQRGPMTGSWRRGWRLSREQCGHLTWGLMPLNGRSKSPILWIMPEKGRILSQRTSLSSHQGVTRKQKRNSVTERENWGILPAWMRRLRFIRGKWMNLPPLPCSFISISNHSFGKRQMLKTDPEKETRDGPWRPAQRNSGCHGQTMPLACILGSFCP